MQGIASAPVVQTFSPAPISVSDRAVRKIAELVAEEGNPELKLRVYVTGGGCAGFQYGFSFEESIAEDDTLIVVGGVSVVLDALSYPYLAGSELDYSEGIEGSRFQIRNPNASTTCGCGSSFSL
ncbi:MAG: iron-sulfur cluster insertion protein ErpA [Gammaproteobacteria bacterium]